MPSSGKGTRLGHSVISKDSRLLQMLKGREPWHDFQSWTLNDGLIGEPSCPSIKNSFPAIDFASLLGTVK
ncbi:hypothetical protein F0562_035759 [Nyssa sinensis]|uniref:Uncharacterized protein n=1 Tax=Nyssa sinensis TaxID=561372 RepID=A0A5J5ADR7_9ASTE|nr:hypothetical protein F0562_035759 [Nyssa sinensis]